MRFDFAGKRVLVTGGGRGIGLGIATAFARAGADLSICALEADQVEAARQGLLAFGGRVHAEVRDIGIQSEVEGWVDAAAAALGGIDVLVNNASRAMAMESEAIWAANLGVDVLGHRRAILRAAPWLAVGRGAVVSISSIMAFRHSPWHGSYSAVKAALNSVTQSMALQLAPRGIRVNAVAPGAVEFPGSVWEDVIRRNPQFYDDLRNLIPFGRLASPAEIADVVLFLASPAARWVTGQALLVDGGQSLVPGQR